jgi:hypothetical protein
MKYISLSKQKLLKLLTDRSTQMKLKIRVKLGKLQKGIKAVLTLLENLISRLKTDLALGALKFSVIQFLKEQPHSWSRC